MKKILLIGVGGVVVLGLIAIIVVVTMIGSIIKKGVETVGPQVAKVPVRLENASVSIASGQGSLKGLFVGNPEGYKTASAIEVGTVSVALKPMSVLSDKVVVESVIVESPHITFEGGLSGNNLSKILQNVQSFAGSSTSSKDEGGAGKKLEVGLVKVTGAKVSLSISGMGGKAADITLPDIELRDLGKGSDGITAADLTARVMDKVVGSTVKAATESITKLGKGVIDGAGDVGKGAADSLKKATKGVGDLFKK